MKKLAVILLFAFIALVALHFFLSPKNEEFMIEDLYEDIIDMDDNELNLWVDDFLDQINDY